MPKSWVSPPALAEELGIAVEKVIRWIEHGELNAVNVATTTTGRPRWRISEEDVGAFLLSRKNQPVVKVQRRRKTRKNEVTFY